MATGKPRLGFIGLGLMGQGFTKRLTQCGYQVCGYDINSEQIAKAQAHGVNAADSSKQLTEISDIVMLCVTTTAAVEEAVFGSNGVVEGGHADKVLVDHSTTVVSNTKSMAGRLKEASGMAWVDAPVSGGPEGAEAGKLAVMAGGEAEEIGTIENVMSAVASNFTHFGPVGSGQIAKMVNQVLVLNNYVVLAEALALAEAGGIDASKIPAALATGHAGSNLLQSAFPRMIARDFAPRGYARQILKDLDTLHDLAKNLKSPTPMSAQATSLYRILNSKGHEDLDGIAILKLFDRNDGV